MNIAMHGKRVIQALSGVGCPLNIPPDGWAELSATYHGDRDEFWVLVKNREGIEVERYNARLLLGIIWDTTKARANDR